MNPRNAAEIALGVAAVWLIVSRIPELVMSLAFLPAGPDGLFRWIGVVHAGLVVLCGLGLAHLRRRIASWLVPVAQPDLTGPIAGFQSAAFSVIGVILVADGLSDLFHQLAISTLNVGRPSAGPLARIAVGLALFVGARGIVAIWQSLRTAGLPSRDRDDGGAA